jgi:hypothetical protein
MLIEEGRKEWHAEHLHRIGLEHELCVLQEHLDRLLEGNGENVGEIDLINRNIECVEGKLLPL